MGPLDRHGDGRPGPRAVAEQQHGLVTREQLHLPRSTIDSWVRRGLLVVVHRGVYALGHRSLTPEARWLAAVLACGPGAMLSHLSAAALWGIIAADGVAVDVIAGRGRKGQPGIAVHRPRAMPARTVHRGIPVTTPERTLVDLARTFTPENLERAVGEAQLLPAFDVAALPARLRALAEEPEHGISRNAMERRFRKLAREAGLSPPEVNQRWGRWELDFLFREEGIAVETDGRATHLRRAQFERDRRKDRDLQLAGLLALRFTYPEVMRRPAVVLDALRRAARSA